MSEGTSATRAKNKYNAKNYDSLRVVTPKGKKETIQQHATEYDKSLNSFVNRAIDETMERDTKKADN